MGSQKDQSEMEDGNKISEGEYEGQYEGEGEGEYAKNDMREVDEEGQEQYSDNQNL